MAGPIARASRRACLVQVAAIVALALGASACERGCLSRRLEGRSLSPTSGGAGPRGSVRPSGETAFDLNGTDCSAGLARCQGGQVEVSVAGHVPHPCRSPGENGERKGSCECPWRPVSSCDAGCVEDGLEVLASAALASEQLCAASEPLLRPLLSTELLAVSICGDEGVSCVEGIVRLCARRGQPARLIAGCAYGCAGGIGVDQEDLGTGDGRAAILCRRAHAERR